MTTEGAFRHFRRAVDVLMEKVWREIGLYRFLRWLNARLSR